VPEQGGLKMGRSNDYIQYFEPRLHDLAESLGKRPGGSLLTETAGEDVIRSAKTRIRQFTGDYFMDLSAQIVKDDNPLAQYDLALLTSEDKQKAASVILRKLDAGELVLPERMQKTVDVILDNLERFLVYMLKCLNDHREEVCALLFGGKLYTKITGFSLTGDTHNHGKCTTIVRTDAGTFVFKPHSCAVDKIAYEFMRTYFEDVIVMPKVYAVGEEFGICEFLEKKAAEGDQEARKYYYSLGGTAAVIKMLGSTDMHTENLFACGTKLALIDIETLLYPYQEGAGQRGASFFEPEDEKALSNSMLRAAFLNMRYEDEHYEKEYSILLNTDEDGSAPVVDGRRRTVLDYREDYFRGFADLYDRCLKRKEELERDIPLYFSNHILRVITWATRSYAEVLKRLNSCYSYSSEAYYQSQLDKLSEVLESEKTIKNSNVTSVEIRYLSEGEIPFFYTYGDRRDIFADGSVVAADYYIQSAVERVTDILDSMGEADKQFEIRLMQLSLSYTKIKDQMKEKEYPERFLREAVPVSKEKALKTAEAILERIYEDGLVLRSGERIWFDFDPAKENCSLMNAGLYTGIAGMAVYFAAMANALETADMKRKAKDCLDPVMHMMERFIDQTGSAGSTMDRAGTSLGEGGGLGGILKAIVLVNRYTEGTYDALLQKTRDLICSIDPDIYEDTDKSGGIAGLIVTLCRYEELYSDHNIQKMIQRLAERLRALRSLEYKDMLLWKTIKPHPISGAVHGMSGIAESFFMADLRLHSTEFEKEAEDALAFENASFDPHLGCWIDRRVPGTRKPARGNCYGPEGMGIICAHLKSAGIRSSLVEHIQELAKKVVCGSGLYYLDHLCCGNMSTVDYYLETGDPDAAGILLAEIIKEAEKNGGYRLGFADCQSNNNVTLFYGLAGIGYELVRYSDRDRFLTVL